MSKKVLLSIRNLDITFDLSKKKKLKAVDDVSFDIYEGETFSLVGESGSGKTTIGRAIVRINPATKGEIIYDGKSLTNGVTKKDDEFFIRNIQMIFQDPAASLNERATVDYIISEGLYNFKLYNDENDRHQKVTKALKDVGLLEEHLTRYPHEFSGGQRQRIGIARALIMDPKLVVADEPISALDVSIRAQVLNLLKKLQAEKNLTYMFIAHDLSVVRFISDRIGVIHKGKIVELAETEELFQFPLHPYTQSLLSAVPMPDPQYEKVKKLYKYDPSIHDYSVDKPSMREIRPGHFVYANNLEYENYQKQIKKAQ